MSSAPRPSYITPEEYLERERAASFKSEYRDGQIFAMSGASRPHCLIAANLARRLGNQLDGRDCELLISEMRVRVQRTDSYCYPDLVIVCGEARMEDQVFDTLLNPTVVIEILSPSTESYDRGVKFSDYRELASLLEYVLVSQDKILIERYTRQGDSWALTIFNQLEGVLRLPSIGCEGAVRDIYARVPIG